MGIYVGIHRIFFFYFFYFDQILHTNLSLKRDEERIKPIRGK